MRKRVQAVLQELIPRPEKTLMVVSHGVFIQYVLEVRGSKVGVRASGRPELGLGRVGGEIGARVNLDGDWVGWA